MIYGIGSISNTSNLKSIIGISLYPWLNNGVNPDLVKIMIDTIEE